MNESTQHPAPGGQPPADGKRRIFLTAALCAPAVAAGALLARQSQIATPLPALPDDTGASAGYHETEHIRQYYRSAAYF